MLFRMCVSSEATRIYGSGSERDVWGSCWIGIGSGRDLIARSTCWARTLSFRHWHLVIGEV